MNSTNDGQNPTTGLRAGDVRLLNRTAAQERVLELLQAEAEYVAEIERLREIVYLYVDPMAVKPEHEATVMNARHD